MSFISCRQINKMWSLTTVACTHGRHTLKPLSTVVTTLVPLRMSNKVVRGRFLFEIQPWLIHETQSDGHSAMSHRAHPLSCRSIPTTKKDVLQQKPLRHCDVTSVISSLVVNISLEGNFPDFKLGQRVIFSKKINVRYSASIWRVSGCLLNWTLLGAIGMLRRCYETLRNCYNTLRNYRVATKYFLERNS